ncbi:MAG: efflux RND transporter periplasmic adaptor subunit [Kofleriaceae bacterium]
MPHDEQSVRLYEPSMQRFVQLDQLECHLAQLMDGRRSLDELTDIAQRYNPSATHHLLERLVSQLNALNLLDRQHAAAPAPVGHRPWSPSSEEADPFTEDFDGPTVLTSAAMIDSGPMPVAALRLVPPPGPSPRAFDAPLPPPGYEIPDTAAAPAPMPVEPVPAPPPAPVPMPFRPSAAQIAVEEQEEVLKQNARRWHQRTWLRVLMGLAAVVLITAFIPYPLRVNAECKLIPSERVKVRTELAGTLVEILVDEGQAVKKGAVIARLDDRALKSERLKVNADIEKIDAELATLRQGRRPEEIDQQRAVLAARRNEAAFAAKEARRRRLMARQGVGSRQDADEASRDLGSKSRAVAEAVASLRLLQAGSRPEEISAKEAVLKRARAELSYVDEKLAMAVVRAPMDGEILTPRFRERVNEGVEVGGLICEIANTRRMRAEILVPEREVDVVALGMPATVKVESYPTHPFEGKVNFIAPVVDGESNRVRVVVELDNAGGLLKANMTGYGEVEAGKRSVLDLATRRVVRWFRVRFLM